jgi:hypothetical protein
MLKPFTTFTDRSNYLGDTHDDYLIALMGYDRLYDANEEELVNRFEKINLVADKDFMLTSIGNFCGPPTNFVLVHKDSVLAVDIAENAKIEMANYPVLDDEIYSRLETTEAQRRWENNLSDDDREELSQQIFGEVLTEWDDIVAHTNFSELEEHLLID